MFIRSERLFLRPAFSEDWREIHRGLADERVARMLPRVPCPYGEEDARAWIAHPPEVLHPRFVITLPGERGAPLIGAIALNKRMDGPDLGFWIARQHWGNGYATEAGRAVLEIARTLGHSRVSAAHCIDNPAAARVLAKLEFRPTCEMYPAFCQARDGDLVLTKRYAFEMESAGVVNPGTFETA